MEHLHFTKNLEQNRYEAHQEGQLVAYAEYRSITGATMFTHTEVNEGLEGKGVGSKLIRFALEDTRAQGLMAIPMCPFVVAFIQRNHDEFINLVHPQQRRIFGL
jgi:uncharacterized protein